LARDVQTYAPALGLFLQRKVSEFYKEWYMWSLISGVVLDALKITGLVFVMMALMDLLNVAAKGGMASIVRGGRWRQYVIASFLGATPGCLGAFADVSMYMHGGLTFGALVGGMIATSGDEAFVMLSLFPRVALVLFVLLFGAGVVSGWLVDRTAPRLSFPILERCCSETYHPGEASGGHYARHHIWEHILGVHLWRVFLWTAGALLLVRLGTQWWHLEGFVTDHALWMLLLGALVGIIPESGPHLIFVTLFAEGLLPFSVLFTSSFVQDGHGILPLLSHSVKDAALVKTINLFLGLGVGLTLYALGW
jgi:hypothetical protein